MTITIQASVVHIEVKLTLYEHIFNEGYRAQMNGQTLADNPKPQDCPEYWLWRRGFLQAFRDSNQGL